VRRTFVHSRYVDVLTCHQQPKQKEESMSNVANTTTRNIRTDILHDIGNQLGATIIEQQQRATDAGDATRAIALLKELVNVEAQIENIDVADETDYLAACHRLRSDNASRQRQLLEAAR
jgi:hypothetical protein